MIGCKRHHVKVEKRRALVYTCVCGKGMFVRVKLQKVLKGRPKQAVRKPDAFTLSTPHRSLTTTFCSDASKQACIHFREANRTAGPHPCSRIGGGLPSPQTGRTSLELQRLLFRPMLQKPALGWAVPFVKPRVCALVWKVDSVIHVPNK